MFSSLSAPVLLSLSSSWTAVDWFGLIRSLLSVRATRNSYQTFGIKKGKKKKHFLKKFLKKLDN